MKSITLKLTIILLTMLIAGNAFSQGVVISDDANATPHGSAMLEIKSTDKGFLPPRMATIEREAIPNPAAGLVIYDTDENSLYLFDGTVWVPLVAGTGSLWEADGDDIYRSSGNVGIGTDTPSALIHAHGTAKGEGNILFVGQLKAGDPGPPPAEGSGTRFMWYPDKAAVRFGNVTGVQWNQENIGINSLGFGLNSIASGQYSAAWGVSAKATGTQTSAWGFNTTASGSQSTAWGSYSEATGERATAWGSQTLASFSLSTAWGSNTEATGQRSTAWGSGSKATGINSTAWGSSAVASGSRSTAFGQGVVAPSSTETALGHFNTIYTPNEISLIDPDDRLFVIGNGLSTSNRSDALVILKSGKTGIGVSEPAALLHANGTAVGEGNILFTGEFKTATEQGDAPVHGEGTRLMWIPDKAAFRAGRVTDTHWDTDSIGDFSMALGYNTKATGDRSTAFGRTTTASGAYSTAMGRTTTARGNTSTAMGWFTVAPSFSETAIGRYNTLYEPLGETSGWNLQDRLFVIGNGISDANRSDALVVLKSGNTGIGISEPVAQLHLIGSDNSNGNVLFEGEYEGINAGPAPAEGSGTRMMWYPGKAAFRAGRVVGSQDSNWDTDSIGLNSTAFGWVTKAKGVSSMAWGTNSYAMGSSATAWGESSKALGSRSTAWGETTEASGQNATSWGKNTKALGLSSTAWGELTEAHGQTSTVLGTATKALGISSMAAGAFTTAHSAYEVVFGYYSTDYTPGSEWGWVPEDRLFAIGNGSGPGNRSNALTMLKNGNTGIGTSNPRGRFNVSLNSGVTDASTIDEYPLLLSYPSNATGQETGIAFRISVQQNTNQTPGAAITHLRTGSGSSGDLLFKTKSGGDLDPVFERMRIVSNGNVGIGTDSPGARLHVERASSSSTPQVRIHNSSSSSFSRIRFTNEAHEPYWDIAAGGSNNMVDFWQSGGTGSMLTLRGDSPNIGVGIRTVSPEYTLHVNGDAGKPGGGSWSSTSDARLKHSIQDLQGSLDALLKLRGVSFLYNDPEGFNELPGERIGMIAQEVAEVFPDWVNEAADGYLRLTFRGFEALIVEALRELREEKDAEIGKLLSANASLGSRIDRLEGLFKNLISEDITEKFSLRAGE